MGKAMNVLNTNDVGFAVRELIKALLTEEVHTCMPGRVESYADGFADVTPLLRAQQEDGSQLDLPKLPGVPVLTLGNKTCGVKFALQAGDIGLLVFAEKSIGKFLQTSDVADTLLNQNFSIGNAFLIPVFFGGETENGADITIYNMGSGKIILGDSALSQFVVTKDFLTSFFLLHVHPDPVSGVSGTPILPPTTPITEAMIEAANGVTTKSKAQ